MFERIICAIFGHEYMVEKRFNEATRKVGCTRCNRKWGMNDNVRAFIPWDSELEELYKPGGLLDDN